MPRIPLRFTPENWHAGFQNELLLAVEHNILNQEKKTADAALENRDHYHQLFLGLRNEGLLHDSLLQSVAIVNPSEELTQQFIDQNLGNAVPAPETAIRQPAPN
jgi:hypothetical protein